MRKYKRDAGEHEHGRETKPEPQHGLECEGITNYGFKLGFNPAPLGHTLHQCVVTDVLRVSDTVFQPRAQ